MKKVFVLITQACIIGLSFLAAQTVRTDYVNPVLKLEDGGVERFMGYFYATGQASKGNIWPSKDLVSWLTPTLGITTNEATWLDDPQWTQAYTYKQLQAADITYLNGVFHAYFNGVGHVYSPTPLGPYKEQTINEPFDDYGIDIQVFQDEDGQLYYIKKRNQADPHPMTGAASDISGPEIWIFKMNSPFNRWDMTEANVQLTHQPGHPTSVNHINFEGPELAKYRDRYYLFYASNRMGPRSGMYQIGVAESDQPMNFNNSKKYPHAVLTRNTEQHLLEYKTILHTAEHGGWSAKHATITQATDWMEPDFDDSAWTTSTGGYGRQTNDLFGGTKYTNALIRARKTAWTTTNIYIRRKFTLEEIPENAGLKYWVFGNADFYINGHLLNINTKANTYSNMEIDPTWLKQGENIIAVKVTSPCSDQYCQQFIDFGLFDTGDKKIENVALGQAQPNFVVGPNGFERWMMYKAYFNASQQQGVDRIHFYDKEAVVESSTVKNTNAFRTKPSLPTFISYFDYNLHYPYTFLNGSEWSITSGILKPKNDTVSELLLRTDSMTHYRYEIPFRIQAGGNDYMSAYAYYKNEDNWLKINIDRDENTWEYEIKENGLSSRQTKALPEKFKFLEEHPLVAHYEEPWHTLTIYKNAGNFKVELDYFNLTLDGAIQTDFTGSGLIGLAGSSSQVNFDAIQYTNGWDEWDEHIAGWETSSGNWQTNENGLQQTAANDKAVAIKGDKQYDYEFSVFMKNDRIPDTGKSGFYPLYVDESNYVEVGVDYPSGKLSIIKNQNGTKSTQELPLSSKIYRQYTFDSYPTTSYRYDFRSETDVCGVNILWFEGNYPYLKQTFDLPDDVKFYALQDDSWTLLDARLEGELRFSYFNRFNFDKVRTKAIKMVVTPPAGKASRAFSAYFEEELAAGYFLRGRRENDTLHVFVNDSLKMSLNVEGFGKSNVGLFTENTTASFNGLLNYQTGKVAVKKISIPAFDCEVGESVELTATIEPKNATNQHLVWISSDPSIASIDENNRLTRHTEGKVSVTAWTADGGVVKATATLGEPSELSSVSKPGISVYPNPASTKLFVNAWTPIQKAEIYTLPGNKVKEYATSLATEELDIQSLENGIYLLCVHTEENIVSSRFIKTN